MSRTAAAAWKYLEEWNENGMQWDAWMAEVESSRQAFARLIGAEPGEVAVTTSVSAATASIASSIDFDGPRNEVVASAAEFPTVGHVWSAYGALGAKVKWVPIRDERMHTDDYPDLINEKTAIVSATHAWYQNGSLQDVAQICHQAHEVGALVFVDAYQSAGVVPIDVKQMNVDFLASGCLKYLLGIPGIAYLYVRQGLADTLHPSVTGWFGRKNPFAFDEKTLDWAPGARRFDTGTPPIFNAYVARQGIETISEIGVVAIRDWTLELSRRIVARSGEHGLDIHGPEDPEKRTPSTAIKCGEYGSNRDSHHVEKALHERGILASARGEVIRLAPHFYNTLDEIDETLDALASILHAS